MPKYDNILKDLAVIKADVLSKDNTYKLDAGEITKFTITVDTLIWMVTNIDTITAKDNEIDALKSGSKDHWQPDPKNQYAIIHLNEYKFADKEQTKFRPATEREKAAISLAEEFVDAFGKVKQKGTDEVKAFVSEISETGCIDARTRQPLDYALGRATLESYFTKATSTITNFREKESYYFIVAAILNTVWDKRYSGSKLTDNKPGVISINTIPLIKKYYGDLFPPQDDFLVAYKKVSNLPHTFLQCIVRSGGETILDNLGLTAIELKSDTSEKKQDTSKKSNSNPQIHTQIIYNEMLDHIFRSTKQPLSTQWFSDVHLLLLKRANPEVCFSYLKTADFLNTNCKETEIATDLLIQKLKQIKSEDRDTYQVLRKTEFQDSLTLASLTVNHGYTRLAKELIETDTNTFICEDKNVGNVNLNPLSKAAILKQFDVIKLFLEKHKEFKSIPNHLELCLLHSLNKGEYSFAEAILNQLETLFWDRKNDNNAIKNIPYYLASLNNIKLLQLALTKKIVFNSSGPPLIYYSVLNDEVNPSTLSALLKEEKLNINDCYNNESPIVCAFKKNNSEKINLLLANPKLDIKSIQDGLRKAAAEEQKNGHDDLSIQLITQSESADTLSKLAAIALNRKDQALANSFMLQLYKLHGIDVLNNFIKKQLDLIQTELNKETNTNKIKEANETKETKEIKEIKQNETIKQSILSQSLIIDLIKSTENKSDKISKLLDSIIIPHLRLSSRAMNEAIDSTGNTLLHLATKFNLSEQTKTLLELGANANLINKVDLTPLHFVIMNNNTMLAKIVLEKMSVINPKSKPLIYFASSYETITVDTLDWLLTQKSDLIDVNRSYNNKTPLLIAYEQVSKDKFILLSNHSGIKIETEFKLAIKTSTKTSIKEASKFIGLFTNRKQWEFKLEQKEESAVKIQIQELINAYWAAAYNDYIGNKLSFSLLTSCHESLSQCASTLDLILNITDTKIQDNLCSQLLSDIKNYSKNPTLAMEGVNKRLLLCTLHIQAERLSKSIREKILTIRDGKIKKSLLEQLVKHINAYAAYPEQAQTGFTECLTQADKQITLEANTPTRLTKK